MKRLLIGIVAFTGLIIQCNSVFAQQDAMFSQYMFNQLAINPAYAGSRNVLAATAIYRNQWVGIEGAPKTGTFTVDAPFSRERIGLGAQIITDKLGVTSTNSAVLSAAYRIPMGEGTLAFGMQGSASIFNATFNTVVLDPSVPSPDAAYRANINKTLFNTGAGAYYNTDRWYAGLSVQELINNRLNNDSVAANGVTARQSAHAFLMAGYVFPLSSGFNLKTGGLVKGVRGAPLQLDANAMLWIKDVLAVGMGWRSNADISFLGELRFSDNIRIGYAYDRSTTSLRQFNSGSHEFMLRYEFSFDRNRILSPRYF